MRKFKQILNKTKSTQLRHLIFSFFRMTCALNNLVTKSIIQKIKHMCHPELVSGSYNRGTLATFQTAPEQNKIYVALPLDF